MVTLGLNTRSAEPPTKESLEDALRVAWKAERLLANPDFQWWRGLLEEGIRMRTEKLINANESSLSDRHRGTIQGLRKALAKLESMASRRAELEELLGLYQEEVSA